MKAQSEKNPRNLVLERGQYTPLPNLMFDEVLPLVPAELFALMAYLYRHTVGFQRWYFEKSLAAIRNDTHINREKLSRWLHVVDSAGWFKYTPAQNGGKASRIRFVRLPDAKEAHNFACALDEAIEREKDWARDNVREVYPDESDYSYEKRPTAAAKNFAEVFQAEFNRPDK